MEFNATLVGIIITVAVLVPVVYMMVKASGSDRKLKESVIKLSQSKGINLQNIDVIGNCVIGVDEVSKKLIYTSKRNLTEDFKIINMTEVKDCRAKFIKESVTTLDWVGLEIVEKAGKLEIPFYNEHDENEVATDPFVCLQDAKRWEKTLRPLFKAS